MLSSRAPLLVLIGVAIAMIPLSLRHLPAPWVWTSLAWCAALFWGTLTDRRTSRRPVWFNLGVLVLAVGTLEAWLWTQAPPKCAPTGPNREYYRHHEVLGYASVPGTTTRWRNDCEGKSLYDTTYTIGSDGLRVPPPWNPDSEPASILFFGGSFTFGEGARDDQTLPYRTGVKTGGRYRIYNFGFNGYGTHHMNAMVDHGMVESRVTEPPAHIIYQAIVGHVRRVAGMISWDRRSPRYVLEDDGEIVRAGQFHRTWVPFLAKVSFNLRKSFILRQLLGRAPRIAPADIDLFVALVDKARRDLHSLYPSSRFHMILWDDLETDHAEVIQLKLQARHINVHRITEILPDIATLDLTRYRLSRGDPHPTPEAYELMADYVVREIVEARQE